MKKLTFLVGLSALLLVGCQKEEALTIQNQAVEFRNDYVTPSLQPFKGSISGIIPTLAEGSRKAQSGKLYGNLTHLGNTKVEYTIRRRTYSTGSRVGSSDQIGYRMEGEYIAPPMDTIIIITDFFTFPDPDDEETNIIEGDYEIKGGKGRFEDAFGSGEITGRSGTDPSNPRKASISLDFKGTIVY